MKNSQHTSKTITYTQQRLRELGISKTENQLTNGQASFQAYYYNRTEDEVRYLSQKEIDLHLAQKRKHDNILIRYANIWGEPLRHRSNSNCELTGNIYYQEPDHQTNGRKWATPVLRLRIHEKNRYPIKNIAEDCWKISPKYRTPKNSRIDIFFNGIYQYYIRPLQQKGFDKNLIIQKVKRLFQKICITEGEFKAYYACKLGIPTLGIGGIHGAVKTIKQTFKAGTMEEYDKTIDANFLKSLTDFLQSFEVKKSSFYTTAMLLTIEMIKAGL